MTTTLLEAGRKILDHLNARIDAARAASETDPNVGLPIFHGIAELHTAVHAAEAAGATPLWICLVPAPAGEPLRVRAWTDDPVRAQQLADDGLQMVPYYAQPDALRGALAGLVEAVRRDADEGGQGISGYTSARLTDARAILGDDPSRAPRYPSVEAWIEANFAGHGRALRREDEAPIPGEPFMSMADAKNLVRRAVAIASWPLAPPARFLTDMPDDNARMVIGLALEQAANMLTTAPRGIEQSRNIGRTFIAAIRALALAKVFPGWKLVPIAPTEAMLDAALGGELASSDGSIRACSRAGYIAALAAAPELLA